MKNAISRFGYTCASALLAAGISGCLLTSSMFAQTANRITVTLPEDVEVGSSVLPAGSYTVQDVDSGSGNHIFVFRGQNGTQTVADARTIDETDGASKTEFVLTTNGSAVHLGKLFIEGSSVAYDFGSEAAGN